MAPAAPPTRDARTADADVTLLFAWVDSQPRTVALAEALGGRAHFIARDARWRGALLLPVRYLVDALETWRLLTRERPDVVVAITPPVFAPLIAWLWCTLHGSRMVMDCHTAAFHSIKWSWTRPIHRWLASRISAVTLHTEAATAEVRGWTANALLLPDDLPERADSEPRSALASKRSDGRPRVVIAGSLNGEEPVEATIEAARLLPDVEFLITGDVSQVPQSLVAGAPPNAVFTGWLAYPLFLDALEGSDVVATFSLSPHIMNRAAFEAIGLSCALVLTDFPGLRARFGDVAMFCSNESTAMAAAIRQAIADSAQLVARSTAAQARLRAAREAGIQQLRRQLAPPAPADRGDRRVLVVSQHPYPSQPLLRRNIEELLAAGAEVDLVCMSDAAAAPDVAHGDRLRVHRIQLAHRRDSRLRYPIEYAAFFLQALPRISMLALRRRFDVVQVDNMPDFLVFSAFVARWRGARVMLYLYELMPELTAVRLHLGLRHPIVRVAYALERAAISWSDHVIAVNDACKAALLARGVPAAKITVIPNPLTFPSALQAGSVRRPVIVTHATLVERYGVHVAIAAFAQLRPERPELRMLVLGAGEQLPALQSLAAALGVADAVEFPGNLPWLEAMSRIRECAVGLVPVLADGYGEFMVPMKLYDYALMGIPAVSSRLPAIQDYFPPDSVTYVEPGNEDELARGIARLLDDPEAVRRQVAEASRAMEPLRWETMRYSYLALLGIEPAWETGGAAAERSAG